MSDLGTISLRIHQLVFLIFIAVVIWGIVEGILILTRKIKVDAKGIPLAEKVKTGDASNAGLNIIAALVPLAGLIMYLVMKDETPNKAKTIGKWTLIGLGVQIGLSVLLTITLLIIAFA